MSVTTNFSDESYIGFSLDGITSDDFGVIRVNTGDRFEEKLFPEFSEIVTNVPGADGQFYFGSRYTQKIFPIDFAFDHLTEAQLARLKEKMNGKGIHTLRLAEYPDRSWKVKPTGTSIIKYIPFEENGQRIYKGEGSVSFTAYSVYALGDLVTIEPKESETTVTIENKGDAAVIYKIYITTDDSCDFTLGELEDSIKIHFPSAGEWILDSRNQTITKVNDTIKNRIYNEYIVSGSFPIIKVGETKTISTSNITKIEYNLLYL